MDLQTLIEGMNAQDQRERAKTQLTLGELISQLQEMTGESQVANLQNPNSYRGYYCDLYFELRDGARNASDLLADCQAAMGQVFTGYKGGEFVMGALTPLWISEYGESGLKLLALYDDGGVDVGDDD